MSKKRPYQEGDIVFIGDLPNNMRHFSYENQHVVILYSYHDRYGGEDAQKYIYAVMGVDGKESAWCPHNIMSLVEDTHALTKGEWKHQQKLKLRDLNQGMD